MPEGKKKFIEDAARLIERRANLLQEELDGPGQSQPDVSQACDRAAIAEARHLARMVRSLMDGPYVSHPHDVARGRLGWGPRVY